MFFKVFEVREEFLKGDMSDEKTHGRFKKSNTCFKITFIVHSLLKHIALRLVTYKYCDTNSCKKNLYQ